MNDYSINAVITLDTSEYKKGINEAQKSTKNFSGNFSKLTKGLGGALLKGGAIGLGITAVTKGFQGLSKVVKQSIKEWEDASAAQKKLAQTLEVTGAAAWTTTEELNAMADAYQKATNFSSNDVTKMQTVLLGFKNISEDTFQSASDAILDMAEVMGMDLVSATQTVGKALDDPISGLGSLSRQGFKFSEAEKELIKNLVEAGESAKAQKIILDELNTTYGGAAEKGAKASIQLKNSWKSLLQEMGRNITMSIDIEPAKKKLNELLDHWREIQKEMADAKEYSDNIIKAQKAAAEGAATYEQNLLLVEDEIKKIQDLRYAYEVAYQTAVNNGWEEEAKYQQEHIDALNRELKPLENRKKIIEEVIALEKQQAEESEKANAAAAEQEQLEASIAALKLKYLKLIAEQEKQWELQKTVTGQAVDLEEKRNFYQTKLVEIMKESGGQITANNQYYKDQQKIIADITAEIEKQNSTLADIAGWNDKLLEQEIARLEARRDSEISAGILDEIDIRNYYNEQIVKLKEQQIERELAVALKGVEGTENEEEAKLKIIEYYNKKKLQNAMEYAKQKKKVDDKSNKTEVKTWKDKFKEMTSVTKNAVSKISGYMSKITKTFISAFKSLNKIDLNDALDTLLKFEDGILTFFVETLPKLPQFLKSAFQSVKVLIASIDFMKVADDFMEVVWTIADEIPSLISSISTIVAELLPKVISGAIDLAAWLLSEGFPALLEGLTNIITSLIRKLPDILEDGIPKLLKGVLDFIPSFFENAGEIISTIVEELPSIITGMINGLVDFLENLSAEDIAKIIQSIITMVGDIASAIIKSIGKIVSELIPALIRLIIELIKSIPDILKGLVTGAFEGVGDVAKSIGSALKDLGGDVLGGVKSAGKAVGGFVKDLFTGKLFASGTDNAPKGLAIVGEAGPELVNFRGGEQVLSNSNTKKVLANGVGGSTFNVAFYNTQDTSAFALVSQLKAYNREMAINSII